jgi:AcrR family transcriptional regulator
MPYPSQITLEQVVASGRKLVERDGVEQFALAGVAVDLGVRTPSLYRYVDSKVALLRLINREFLVELFRALEQASVTGASPTERLTAVLHAYRAFAHANPRIYQMAFAYDVDPLRPDEDFLGSRALPLHRDMAAISGEAGSLAALRGAFALVHGWVMLELTDQLRRGGDLGADFRRAAGAYLAGWGESPVPANR